MFGNRCNVSSPKEIARLGLIMFSLLALLAACGSNNNPTTAGGTTPTAAAPTATATPTPTIVPTPTPTTPTGPVAEISMSRSGAYTLFFAPDTVTISVGTTVIWTNRTPIAHTVTSDDGKSFDSGTANPIAEGITYSFKFTKPGTYKYHCAFHKMMIGTIIVT